MGKSKKNKKLKLLLIIAGVSVLVFLLFPRVHVACDGGSARFCSIFEGLIYEIDSRHGINDEGGKIFYEEGCIIYVFRHEVYNNVNMIPKEVLDAEFHRKNAEIESLLFPTG